MELLCKWCGETKDEAAFVKRVREQPFRQGNVRCCRECNSKKNRERYKVPVLREKQLAANAAWRLANPERQRSLESKFLKRNPANLKARTRVGYLLRRGYWTKQPCIICGSTEVEAHHDSYAKPHWEIVRWLCKDHHEAWHQKLDPVKRALLDEPLRQAQEFHDERAGILRQAQELRRAAADLEKRANSIEHDAWSEVLRQANQLFPRFIDTVRSERK